MLSIEDTGKLIIQRSYQKKKDSKSEVNIAQAHGNNSDSSGYSLSITLVGYCSEESE